MTELILGLLLSLLALLGFLFNIYIVLALLLTKQVSPPLNSRNVCYPVCGELVRDGVTRWTADSPHQSRQIHNLISEEFPLLNSRELAGFRETITIIDSRDPRILFPV